MEKRCPVIKGKMLYLRRPPVDKPVNDNLLVNETREEKMVRENDEVSNYLIPWL